MSGIADDWLADARRKGQAWYARRHKLALELGEASFSLEQVRRYARFAAITRRTLDGLPGDVPDVDRQGYVAAFVAGAIEAWQQEQG